jgi:hypothetical protein
MRDDVGSMCGRQRGFIGILLAGFLIVALAFSAAAYTDYFTTDPGAGSGSASFSTGSSATGLAYTFYVDGDGGDFAYFANQGDGGSACISALSGALNSGTTERFTIVSRDGKAFDFNSIWIDMMGDGITLTGYGPEPFVLTCANGVNTSPGGARLVTSLEFSSTDFYDDLIDTVDVNLDVPGMDVQGSGTTIINGDNSPSVSDDTDLGTTAGGTPVSSTFTIRSIGDLALDLAGSPYVTISGSADFTITSQPSTDPIASGGSTTFVVQFNPSSSGLVTATVSIDNDSEADPYTFDVQGTGDVDTTKPDVTINQAGGQADPTNSSPINFTVVFNESVTGFATGDVTLGGTAGATIGTVTGSGATYNVAVSGMTGNGTVTATIAAGVAQDAASNTNNASSSTDNSVTYDGTKPNVTINQKVGQVDPTNTSPVVFTVVFDEPINDATFTNADVSVGGTATTGTVTVTEVAPNDDTTFEVSIVVTADGTVEPTIPAGGAGDPAGNTNTVSTSADNSVTVDGTKPNVTINKSGGQADPTSGSPVLFTVVFDEPINDATFINADVSVGGTATTGTVTVTEIAPNDDTTFSVSIVVTTDGTVEPTIPAGGVEDPVGNTNTVSTSTDNSVTYDTTKPDVTIAQAGSQADPTNSSPINFTVVFNESVTGFATGDVTLGGTAGATTGTVTGSGTTYNVAVSGMTGNGTVTATIASGVAQDAASNTNNASTSTDNTVSYDAVKPDVTINQKGGQADPTNASPVVFTAIFDEPINDATFTNADISVGGTATTGTVSVTEVAPNDDTTFEVSIVVTADGTVAPTIPAGGVEDQAGNTNTVSTSADNSVTVDGTKPNVTINKSGGQADPTSGSPVLFTVVFDEPINDATFINADVSVGGTATTGTVTVTEIAPNDDTTFSVSIVVTGDGTVEPTIPAGGVEDPVGNTNTVSTSTDNSVTYDATKPDVTITQAGGQADPTNTSPVVFTVVFDEPINDTTFTDGDVTVGGTATTGTVTVTEVAPNDDTTFEVSIVVSADGTVVPTIPAGGVEDPIGNTNTVSTSTDNSVTYDNTDPIDPTPSSASHTVSVWDNDNTVDIQISGASDSGSGVDGFDTAWDQIATWTATEVKDQEETWTGATFTATSDGDWYFHIATVDNVGNWTSTEHLGPFQIDTADPSVPIGLDPSSGSYSADTSPVLSWTASTDTGGSGIRTTDAYRIVVTGPVNRDTYVSDTDYNPTLSEGPFTWKVYARDNAGNSSSYSADTTLTIDATQPDVTVNQAGGQTDPTNTSPILFTAVFDEPINLATFTNADVSMGGTATTGAVTVAEIAPNDATTFSISVVVSGDGTVIASIPAGGVEDYATNTNTASTSTDNEVTYDVSKPNVTIDQAGTQSDPTNAFPITFTAVFDEPINIGTFTAGDVSVAGTYLVAQVAGISEIAPNNGTTFSITVNVLVHLNDGTLIATIPAGRVEDLAGNTNEASTSTDNSVTMDTDPPELTAVSPNAAYDADAGVVSVSITFDEAMDTGTNPSPTITGLATDPYTIIGSSWSNGDQTWTGTFTLVDDNELATGDYIVSGFKDVAGNTMVPNSAKSIEVDTANPTADVSVDTDPIVEGDLTQVVTITFTEAMLDDGTADPSISFSAGTWASLGDGDYNPADTEWTETFTLTDNNEEISGVTIDVSGTKDANGNDQQGYTPLPEFDIDTVKPWVTDVTVDTDPVYEGDLTQFVTVTFSEAMRDDATADPTITFGAGTWASAGDGAYNPADTIWTETFTLTDNDEEIDDVTVDVTGAKDAAGNNQEDYTALPEFDIDAVKPSVTDVAVDTDPVYEGDLTQFVTATFDEAMLDNGTADPVISFSGGTWTSNGDGAYNPGDTVWTEMFTLTDNDEEIDDVTVDVTGAKDAAGNNQEDYTALPEFDIDTKQPELPPAVGTVTVDTNPVYEGDLTQQITVIYSEGMDTSAIPSVLFSDGTWTEDVGSRTWSGSDTTFTVTYTLTDNNEEYHDGPGGPDVVTVDVTGGQDKAGNAQTDYTPQTEFDIDTLQPTMLDATSLTVDGCYTTWAGINITLTFSEDVRLNSNFLELTLDVGGARAATYHAEFTSWGVLTDTRSGAYIVAGDENSCDLTLLSYETTVPDTLLDWAGNVIDYGIPAAGSNIADHKAIVIDTTIPVAVRDPNGDENRAGSNDTDLVDVRLDPFGEYRLTVRENTPVYIDVMFNDVELPCASAMLIYDIPQPAEWGSAWFDDPAGNIRYAPDLGYIGADEFTYRIYDGCGNISAAATVYVEVVPWLVVEDQFFTVCANGTASFEVAVADLLVPETEFTVSIESGPLHGVVVGDLTDVTYALPGLTTEHIETATIGLTYTPSEGFVGRDELRVRFEDPFGGVAIAVVDIVVGQCVAEAGTASVIQLFQGRVLPLILPISFESVFEAGWGTVTLTLSEDGTHYPDLILAEWNEVVNRHILTINTEGLPPGRYELKIPLGTGEIVTLTLEVGEGE